MSAGSWDAQAMTRPSRTRIRFTTLFLSMDRVPVLPAFPSHWRISVRDIVAKFPWTGIALLGRKI